jgi:hypothetical protein
MLPGAACKGTPYEIEESKRKAQQDAERRNDMLTQSYSPPSFGCGVGRVPDELERIVSCPSG